MNYIVMLWKDVNGIQKQMDIDKEYLMIKTIDKCDAV